jgi:RNA polymerase sigma factor (sigma-70 family)
MYSRETKEEVMVNYGNLLKKEAKRALVPNTRYSYNDLLSEAHLAALEAMNSWDDEKGKNIKFITYLTECVRGHLKRFKKSNAFDIKVTEYKILKDFGSRDADQFIDKAAHNEHPIASEELDKPIKAPTFQPKDAIAIRLDWYDSDSEDTISMAEAIPSGEMSPDIQMLRKEQIDVLMKQISALPERERYVIEARWLDRRKLDDIASDLGVKKQTVHNIEKKAREKLGKRVRDILGGEIVE